MANNPVEVKVSDGLAEFFKAADNIPEQKVNELAEKSKNEALKNKMEKESKSRDGKNP